MISLHPQTWQQVRHQWGWIRSGLQAILERTESRWVPEDVWTALRGAHAFLYTIRKNDDDVGFIVCRKIDDPDGCALFVWCLWTEADAMRDCYRDVIAELDKLAAAIGAGWIRMESPREAWNWGGMFTPTAMIFEREVTP